MSKSPVWDDPWTGNMVNGPKHWINLNDGSFTIFVDHCQGDWVAKSHSQWYAKSRDFSLPLSLPETSILFLVETIQCKQFRCIYRKNKKFFSLFFCIFQIYIKFWKFSKIDDLLSLYFSEDADPKNVVR